MTLCSRFQSGPIDMDGFQTLRVTTRRCAGPNEGPGPVSPLVLRTQDTAARGKNWVVQEGEIPNYAGTSTVADFKGPGRFARVEAVVSPGGDLAGVSIRVERLR